MQSKLKKIIYLEAYVILTLSSMELYFHRLGKTFMPIKVFGFVVLSCIYPICFLIWLEKRKNSKS